MVEPDSSSPDETERIAAAGALGIEGPVTSPTYVVGRRYAGEPDLSHVDLYRFDGMSDAEWGDLEGYFEEAVVFVEWPEAGEGFLPPARVRVRLQLHRDGHRLIVLESPEKALEISLSSRAGPRV